MQIKPLVLAKGAATFVPGVMKLACGGSGGTDSSRYCYSVWLRHLCKIAEAGIEPSFRTVAELGPGDSLGIGLSAMLTGADRYFAFDAVAHARDESNLRTLSDLVDLFSRRESIPGTDDFPEIAPAPRSLEFPHAVLPEARLARAMAAARVACIRSALEHGAAGSVEVRYFAPWSDSSAMQTASVDFAFSQAVLEHVENIEATYAALFRWLKPGAVMSHEIDFKSHGLTRDWYGHWTVSSWLWRIVRGRRPYLINRLPASAHVSAIRAAGFEIVSQEAYHRRPPAGGELAAEFRALTDDDLQTSGLYVLARKPSAASGS
jgi:hypothetical protein